MARPRFAITLLFGLTLSAGGAWAATFQDPGDRFRLDFRPATARVCVLVPASETTQKDCAGVDVDTLRRLYAAGPEVRGAVAVVRGETTYNLLYAVQTPAMPAATPASAAAFARGLLKAARTAAPAGQVVRERDPAVPFAIERHGRAEVIRVDLVFEQTPLAGGAPEVQEQVTYAILGERAVHCLYLIVPQPVAAEARRDLASALVRLEVEPAQSPEYRLGRVVGLAIGVIFGLVLAGSGVVAIGLLVLLLVRRRRSGPRGPR